MTRAVRRYDASSITVQSQMEAVRSSPGMYLGDVDHLGALQCAKEILHNATDESRECGGGAIAVRVRALADGRHEVLVADRGRGIPVERHRATGVSTLETVFTHLHAGGKSTNKSAYGTRTTGVHGVGAAVVCACSERLEVWTLRGGQWHHLLTERGVRTAPIDHAEPPLRWPRGTVVRYVLDRTVVPGALRLADLRQLCGLVRYWDPIEVRYHDDERDAVLAPRPVTDLLEQAARRRGLTVTAGPVSVVHDGVHAVVAWTGAARGEVVASVAGCPVPSGTHVQGLELAVRDAVASAVRGAGELDASIGMLAVLDVSVDQPSFSGQAKTALRTPETRRRVRGAIAPVLTKWMRKNRDAAKRVVEHARCIGQINDRAEERRELARTKRGSAGGLPLRFKSATGYAPARRELFILEGRSAEGSALDAKEPWQEVLPIRGKLPNLVRRASLAENEIIRDIVRVVGYDANRPERPLRVGKVVLLCDADDDGQHIEVLLMTALYRVMPEVVQRGLLYVVDAPLFEAVDRAGRQVTGDSLRDMQRTHGPLRNVNRMKGWGGCNAPLLNTVAFHPATRRWLRVLPPGREDAQKFEALMGAFAEERRDLVENQGAPA